KKKLTSVRVSKQFTFLPLQVLPYVSGASLDPLRGYVSSQHSSTCSGSSSWVLWRDEPSSLYRDSRARRGRLCSALLAVAVFLVVLTVLAIAGLSVYMGALRIDTNKSDLVFDGSVRVTSGDEFVSALSDNSTNLFKELGLKYQNMLTPHERLYAVFQQDGATCHTSRESISRIHERFTEGKVSKGLWPPRSPDLTTCDFYLWGRLKGKVYANNPRTLEDLKDNILNEILRIDAAELRKVYNNILERLSIYDNFVKYESWRIVVTNFRQSFPDSPKPSKAMIFNLVKKFHTIGSELDKKRTCVERVLTEEMLDEVGH
ncbi:hypothetical protein ANN_20868, partial [Periplaneta americana]